MVFDYRGMGLRVMSVNSDYFTGNGTRGVERLVVEGFGGKEWVEARRLTAGTALSRASEGSLPTFGGRWFESDCSITRKEEIEVVKVVGGKAVFEVAASEALIIDLC